MSPLKANRSYLRQAQRATQNGTILEKTLQLTGDDELKEAIDFLRATSKQLEKYARQLEDALNARLRASA